MPTSTDVWTKVYDLAGKADPSHRIVRAPAWADSTKPLMVIVHPGDVTAIDLKEEYEDDPFEMDSQYLFQNGMGEEIREWLDRDWDVVVLHGSSSAGFARREEEAEIASDQAVGLHDNIECMAQFDSAIESVHEKCGVMYGEDLGAFASDLMDSGEYNSTRRPAVVLTGSYKDTGHPLSRLGDILEEAGVTVYTSVNLPTTMEDAEEWAAKAGSFNFQIEKEIVRTLEQGAPRP